MRDVLLWPIPALFLVADYLGPAMWFALGVLVGAVVTGI